MSTTATKNRIQQTFEKRNSNEKLMNLFVTAGYPEAGATVPLVKALDKAGADMIELGMPYSDPLADGPTIQESSEIALKNGINLDKIFEMIREIRKTSEIPIILMGYVNPVLHYGIEEFCKTAAEAGADGLIIPDIPPEEAYIIRNHTRNYGLSLIYLVAPNTPDDRMRRIDDDSEGFVYCVSVTGVTGARQGEEVARSVNRFIDRVVSNVTKNPKLIGFGIQSHDDAMKIADKVEGYIVGSALIKTIKAHYPEGEWMDKTISFVKSLKYGDSNSGR